MALRFMYVFYRIILTTVFVCASAEATNKSQRTAALETILNGYNANLPPDYDSGTPVVVSVQLCVLSIDNIDETAMDYSMTVYFRQSWTDHRLRYEPFNVTRFDKKPIINNFTEQTSVDQGPRAQQQQSSTYAQGMENIARLTEGKLELDTRAMNKVWVPDTFFYTERKASFHDMTVPNRLIHIFSNGTVYYSIRISLTLTCHMILTKYPFDRQQCPLQLGSYGYSDEILTYKWSEKNALEIIHNMELPTFTISDWFKDDCNNDEFDTIGGKFSCLSMKVSLARSYGFYIAQVYVPSVLVVILSWVSFWLDIEAIPARISLGLLTVLTMTTMSVGSRSSLPRVSYLKAIDVWNAACLLFVFAALLEFAYVNVSTRVEKRRMSMMDAVNLATGKETNVPRFSRHQIPKTKVTVTNRQRARRIDKIARLGFPGTFITFNIFYWCFYII